jgi:hypothetical protein
MMVRARRFRVEEWAQEGFLAVEPADWLTRLLDNSLLGAALAASHRSGHHPRCVKIGGFPASDR